MTQVDGGNSIQPRKARRRAAGPQISRERHRMALYAAAGAVVLGAVGLGLAVSGGMPGLDLTAQTGHPSPASEPAAKVAEAVPAAPQAKIPAEQAPTKTAVQHAAPEKAGAGKDRLSPDERIARAMPQMPSAGEEKAREVLAAAIKAKAAKVDDGLADTVLTAAIPESAAYAPAMPGTADPRALDAIRNLDNSTLAEPEREPAEEPPKEAAKPAAPTPTGPLAAASVSDDVNLRAAAANGAAVVTTVPANAAVQASPSCKSWCEVVYNGHHGYVYKDFIRRTSNNGQAKADATASAPKTGETAGTKAGEQPAGDGILAQSGDAQALAEASERAWQARR